MPIREGKIAPITKDKIRLSTDLQELPTKLSDTLETALSDLELCEKDDKYKVDLDAWHKPSRDEQAGKDICSVDLAGAVLAKTLGFPPDFDWEPSCAADSPDKSRMMALEYIRMNHITAALEVIDQRRPKAIEDEIAGKWIDLPAYDSRNDGKQFKSTLRRNIAMLRTYDL
jgi:hypothetical protein